MLSPDLVITMLVTARNTGREVKITSSVKGTKKGLIQRLAFEESTIFVEIDGEVFAMDMNWCEVKNHWLDPRVFVVKNANETFKLQMYEKS